MFSAFLVATICVFAPVPGPIVTQYAPSGSYAGHWGVDFAAPPGANVVAPVSGVVTFAGQVAGMKTVTIEVFPGLKVSVSYLSEVSVGHGARVFRGQRIGSSGLAHGLEAVHLSVRVGGSYVDPVAFLGCRSTDIPRALRLVTPPTPYPRGRENRDFRRNLRSDPHRPPPRR